MQADKSGSCIYIILLRKRKLTKLRFGLCLLKEH
jgi:hypothetical protein